MAELTSFQAFYSEDEAAQLATLLTQNDIYAVVVKSMPIVDEVIIGQNIDQSFHVKIRDVDFKRANQVVETQIKNNLSEIGNDYYLYSFSDAELFEIINKPDEWSKQDFFIAKRILAERGTDLPENAITEIKWKRIKEIGSPERGSPFWIIIGYIFSTSGIFGFLFGLAYLNAKKRLPDGSKVFVYDVETRSHGRIIVILSCIFLIINILTGIYRAMI